jgi:HD-GYP domain-containing protein (c-di-GMP phosphodiesterase class II)
VASAADNMGIRRAEIIAALSIATDLALGQPVEFALRSCVLGVGLGECLGAGPELCAEIYWQSLLRYIGCNADAHAMAALFGDETRFRHDFALIDTGAAAEVLRLVFRYIHEANAGEPPLAMLRAVVDGMRRSRQASKEILRGHCDVAQRLAERLGFGEGTIACLGQIYERWDGRGLPDGLKGEAIAPAVRIVTLVQDYIALSDAHGSGVALATVARRRRKAYDPAVADCFARNADALLSRLAESAWVDRVLALEPEPQQVLDEAAFDDACLAMADFIDVKSPFTLGHSRAVAKLAEAAAGEAGLPAVEATALRHAGLLHDIGMAGIPSSVLVKEGQLGERQWEQVRLHPYYAERILGRPPALARLAEIVGRHHERLDGSGYHRGIRADALSVAARILAAAEAYQSMREARSHRAALSPSQAEGEMRREVRAGRLDGDAVAAVLCAAGHRVSAVRRAAVSDLTPREIEVLELIASGRSMKEIGRILGIAPKTVDNHIQHLYAKIEVKTRVGAALFAVEHGIAGQSAVS